MLPFQPPPGVSYTQTNGVLTCNLDSLTNSGSIDLALVFYADVEGTFTNNASVAAGTPDLNSNNTSSLSVTVVPSPNAPLLKVIYSGSNVILFWSTNAVGYSLQSRTNFSSASPWGAVTNVPQPDGSQTFVTNDTTAGTSFYRLIK